ncbi:MAG: TonB-dependent receptor plug domain-containing protein, partial [Alphaproteobacteria bacterium]|nr:TonB-dependent receptor plug domain-containing protein [Alphaproteobacteria bacterium]
MSSPLPRVSALAIAATLVALAPPALAQQALPQQALPQQAEEIVVTAQAENATEVVNGGDAGVLGNKPAEDLPFSIRSFDESLILNQQPLTLGDVLENDPTIRATYGFGNAAELFVIRGFTLAGDDLGMNGLYGIAPRQIVAPELYDSVQVLNGASAFLNGAA